MKTGSSGGWNGLTMGSVGLEGFLVVTENSLEVLQLVPGSEVGLQESTKVFKRVSHVIWTFFETLLKFLRVLES